MYDEGRIKEREYGIAKIRNLVSWVRLTKIERRGNLVGQRK